MLVANEKIQLGSSASCSVAQFVHRINVHGWTEEQAERTLAELVRQLGRRAIVVFDSAKWWQIR